MYYLRSDRLIEKRNLDRVRWYADKNPNKEYDEIVVPSRLVWVYKKFGWQQSKRKRAEELDRKAKGQRPFADYNKDFFRKRTDRIYQERLRRKKRYGYSWALNIAEWQCIYRLNHPGRGMYLVAFLCVLLGIAMVAALVLAMTTKYPTTVGECDGNGGFRNTLISVSEKLDSSFHGDRYYVLGSEVSSDVGKTGRVYWNKLKVYLDGDAEGTNYFEEVKDLVTVDDDGYADILFVKSQYDNETEKTTYFYYVLFDRGQAPLGGLNGLWGKIARHPLAYGFASLFLLLLVLFIVFLIWWIVLGGRRYRFLRVEECIKEGEKIVSRLQNEDPRLLPRSTRMKQFLCEAISEGINAANIGQNDGDPWEW